MKQSLKKGLSLAECVAGYDLYALEVRGLAASTREMHRRLLRKFCVFRFVEEPVLWDAVCFTDIVRFLTAEFERFPNRGTQRASLTSMRTLLRYLAEKNMVPKGWDEALPRTTTRRHAHLPRQVSREQVSALFRESQGNRWIARRDRALLLLFLRLGLRCEEVAHLKWEHIDWQAGSVKICSQKSRRERVLPLPEDVGRALAAYLRTFHTMPAWIFDSSRTTFPVEMRRLHIKAITKYFFKRAGVVGGSAHGLRHTVATNMVKQAILTGAVQPPANRTRWSCRSMARAQKVSPSTVQRIWSSNDIQPHLTRTFKTSNDTRFEEKFWDVIGLYLNPPDKALVLCCDEKSQCQALERTQPALPLGIGHIRTATHDYIRHGTVTLFAALNYLEGKIVSMLAEKHRHQEWLRFLKRIDRQTPKSLALHLIVDNYATHKHPEVRTWLAKHPRFHLHFTPTSASWMNLVERFFRDLTEDVVREGSFRHVKQLCDRILAYLAERNANPTRYTWNAKGEDILRKIEKARQALPV